MKPRISHVGSLPFTDPLQALNYTFEFDLPVLFSLPKKDPDEFMLTQVIKSLKLDSKNWDHASLAEISIPYMDLFRKRHDGSDFKYQLVGPHTLWKCIDTKNILKRSNQSDFYDYILAKYTNALKELSAIGELIFFLDEPMLAEQSGNDLTLLEDFIEKLRPFCKEIGLHCCGKVLKKQLPRIELDYLNLDLELYDTKTEPFILEITAPGLGDKSSFIPTQNTRLLTPSCGLALKSIESTAAILKGLKLVLCRDSFDL